jgi:hypothetical protein
VSRFFAQIVLLAMIAAGDPIAVADGPDTPETRALAYLAREVPRWEPANGCYSCHHNGDAARALFTASRLGFAVPPEALGDTTRWLVRPDGWEQNGGEGPFSDKRLARVQFAAALRAAVGSGVVVERTALRRAAEQLARDQSGDGSWPIEGGDELGSPVTYGRALVTALAREVLHEADPRLYRAPVARADRWLADLPVRNVPDAVAVLLVHDAATGPGHRALDWLRRAQGPDGGWGPFAGSPPEPFDTALALLALQRASPAVSQSAIDRGRAALIAGQLADGSWPETTRPPGAESYAQRLSTTAWATLAMISTQGPAGVVPPASGESPGSTRKGSR